MANVNSVSEPFYFPHHANAFEKRSKNVRSISRVDRSPQMDVHVQRRAAS